MHDISIEQHASTAVALFQANHSSCPHPLPSKALARRTADDPLLAIYMYVCSHNMPQQLHTMYAVAWILHVHHTNKQPYNVQEG
jgi:hypothetical protein